jgi:hypothetical protein
MAHARVARKSHTVNYLSQVTDSIEHLAPALLHDESVYTGALTSATAVRQTDPERQSSSGWLTETDAGRQAILEQLERLLASPAFHNSKRLSGFLKFIVEQTLENDGCDLKERTIGVHVFGRPPDYDTSSEPIVRVSAGDLRKRIARYYHDPGHAEELRIDLPTGSYHPVFYLPDTALASIATLPVISPLQTAREESAKKPARKVFLIIAGIALAGVMAATLAAFRMPGNAYEQFWGPVAAEDGPVLVYAGGRPGNDRMVFEDAVAVADLTGDIRARNKTVRILKESDLSPETLKLGPAILIGGFTNPLARRLTQQLRFTFAREGDAESGGRAFIQDRQNLNSKTWSVPFGSVANTEFTDYAIVSRVVDPVTGHIAVVSAGIRRHGTLAAAEFLIHPEQLEAVTPRAPRDWRKSNMQAVLAIDVKDGKASPAHVVASYFW